jgi:hypothetical protein
MHPEGDRGEWDCQGEDVDGCAAACRRFVEAEYIAASAGDGHQVRTVARTSYSMDEPGPTEGSSS